MTAPMAFAEQLRLRTYSQHQQLEQTRIARSLMSTTLTLATYADILGTWGAAWKQLETVLKTTCYRLQVPNLVPAERGTKADIDLHYLTAHHAVVRHQLKKIDHQAMASPQTLASFVGICYVLRGASLGGKVIARHLATTLGLTSSHGAAFFSPGEEGATWREWMQQADTLLHEQLDIDQATDAATGTFTFLIDKFS